MVVEDNCDAGGFELGHTPLLETGVKIVNFDDYQNMGSSPDA